MRNDAYLFQQGVDAFNNRCFYDAHEFWEELWLNYKLEDAQCIQGLIQLAVSYFHLFNDNLKGARSMIRKCLIKFQDFNYCRGIDIARLIEDIEQVESYFNEIDITSDIEDRYILTIKVIH
mgnify:CR=1 FL=1